ncbi:hypothetical protein ACOME3_007319 [Neoechinorhynchus agilis]
MIRFQIARMNFLIGKEISVSLPKQSGALKGLRFVAKDNFCLKSSNPTTCASRVLVEHKPVYTATAITNLIQAGAELIGKSNMDEFGAGSHSSTGIFGPVLYGEKMESPGGSSGGSAVAVATKYCDFALGSDTGGSTRFPAARIGFKPSYGRINRHGLIGFADSLDTVGILARDLKTVDNVFKVLKEPIDCDWKSNVRVIGPPSEWDEYCDLALDAYIIISCVEMVSCFKRYHSRDFGPEIQSRLKSGHAFYSNGSYVRAMKVRNFLTERLNAHIGPNVMKIDALLGDEITFDEKRDGSYMIANLLGCPSICLRGHQYLCTFNRDDHLLKYANAVLS